MGKFTQTLKRLLNGPTKWEDLSPQDKAAAMAETSKSTKAQRKALKNKVSFEEEVFGDERIIGARGINLTHSPGTPGALMSNILGDERRAQADHNKRHPN